MKVLSAADELPGAVMGQLFGKQHHRCRRWQTIVGVVCTVALVESYSLWIRCKVLEAVWPQRVCVLVPFFRHTAVQCVCGACFSRLGGAAVLFLLLRVEHHLC